MGEQTRPGVLAEVRTCRWPVCMRSSPGPVTSFLLLRRIPETILHLLYLIFLNGQSQTEAEVTYDRISGAVAYAVTGANGEPNVQRTAVK